MRTTTEKNSGWFKVERSQWESGVLRDNEERFAWVDLLSLCNYKDEEIYLKKTQKNVTIHAGQIFTSLKHLSERWSWQRSKVNRFILHLKRNNWVNIDRNTNGTVITIMKSSKNATVIDNEWNNGQNSERNTDRNAGRNNDRNNDRNRIKNINTDKNINNSQDPKNTAKRSGFVWGEDE